MADSVRELIVKDIVAVLATVTIANGYSITFNAVERMLQSGQTAQAPLAYVIEGDDEVTGEYPLGAVSRDFSVGIVVMIQQDESEDARSASEAMNAVIADVQKALQLDARRGEKAVNTEEIAVSAIEADEGLPILRATIGYRVKYRHARVDPAIVI